MTITGTPIDNLQFSDGNDPIATGDDLIRAALLVIDGRLHTPGDLKHSVQVVDHGLWVAADGRNNIVRADVHPDFITLMTALGYTGYDGAHIGLPDYRGRILVGLGQHADVNEITDNENVTVANRRPKHSHTVGDLGHKHPFRSNAVDDGIPFMHSTDSPGGAGREHQREGGSSAQGNIDSAVTGVTVGPQTAGTPVDGPAYGVGCIFIFVGKP